MAVACFPAFLPGRLISREKEGRQEKKRGGDLESLSRKEASYQSPMLLHSIEKNDAPQAFSIQTATRQAQLVAVQPAEYSGYSQDATTTQS